MTWLLLLAAVCHLDSAAPCAVKPQPLVTRSYQLESDCLDAAQYWNTFLREQGLAYAWCEEERT